MATVTNFNDFGSDYGVSGTSVTGSFCNWKMEVIQSVIRFGKSVTMSVTGGRF